MRRDLALTPSSFSPGTSTTAWAPRSSRPICRLPWYRITRAEGRLLARFAARWSARCGTPSPCVELGCGSGEKLALLAEALRAGASGFSCISSTSLPTPWSCPNARSAGSSTSRSSATAPPTKWDCATPRRERPTADDARALPGLEHRQLRPSRRRQFLAEIRAACGPATRCSSASTSSSPSASCTGLRRSARRHRGLQQERSGPHESRAARRLRSRGLRASRRLEPDRTPRRDAPRFARAQNVLIPAPTYVAFARGERIWTESSYKYEARTPSDRPGGRVPRERQWIEPDARFAVALFVAD